MFAGGTGIPAMGLRLVADVFESSENVPKIAMFLTDGQNQVQAECAHNKTQQLKSDGVEMYAIGKLLYCTTSE